MGTNMEDPFFDKKRDCWLARWKSFCTKMDSLFEARVLLPRGLVVSGLLGTTGGSPRADMIERGFPLKLLTRSSLRGLCSVVFEKWFALALWPAVMGRAASVEVILVREAPPALVGFSKKNVTAVFLPLRAESGCRVSAEAI
jgi:hypothetical protein